LTSEKYAKYKYATETGGLSGLGDAVTVAPPKD